MAGAVARGAQAGAGERCEEEGAAEVRCCGPPAAPLPIPLRRSAGRGGRGVGKGGVRLSLGRAGLGEAVYIWFCCCSPAPFLNGNKVHQPCPGQAPSPGRGHRAALQGEARTALARPATAAPLATAEPISGAGGGCQSQPAWGGSGGARGRAACGEMGERRARGSRGGPTQRPKPVTTSVALVQDTPGQSSTKPWLLGAAEPEAGQGRAHGGRGGRGLIVVSAGSLSRLGCPLAWCCSTRRCLTPGRAVSLLSAGDSCPRGMGKCLCSVLLRELGSAMVLRAKSG